MSELKLYRAKLKTRKQIMAEIPREQQGWWADVCAGETLYLRDATEADLERCNLGPTAPRDPAEYLCENIERGSLVRRIAVAEITEIPARGLVAHHNESVRLRARVQELEAELERRAQPSADNLDVCAEMRALCSACGGTGDVHRADGEWLGVCDCPASQWRRDKLDVERWRKLIAATNSTILHFYNTRPDLRTAFVDALPAAPAQAKEGEHG